MSFWLGLMTVTTVTISVPSCQLPSLLPVEAPPVSRHDESEAVQQAEQERVGQDIASLALVGQ